MARYNRRRWYVGAGRIYVAFSSVVEPTSKTHGHLYNAVIGPFKTKRGALWAALYGAGNPHFQHVRDAERLSQCIVKGE